MEEIRVNDQAGTDVEIEVKGEKELWKRSG